MFEKERSAMVEVQLKRRGIEDERLLFVMNSVPRHKFVPKEGVSLSYGDFAVPIGHSQTISQPFMTALMIELLNVEEFDKVLEIGSGSGYATAVLSGLCGKIIAVEKIPELAEKSKKLLHELKITNAKVVCGDGSVGEIHYYPYDRILVSAACPEIPKELISQLRIGGILVAPVGGRLRQTLVKIVKTKTGIKESYHGECSFVPLTGKKGFQR